MTQIKITKHCEKRVEERYDDNIHFKTWFKDALKRLRKNCPGVRNVLIYKRQTGEKDGRYGLWYDYLGGIQFIYEVETGWFFGQKGVTTRQVLITTYRTPRSDF